MQLSDSTMLDFSKARQETPTVILPLGSVEEHGPHLPLSTDTFHALEIAQRVAQRRPVMVAPPLHYGICRSTREHPGTISISMDTLRALARELGREFYRQGLRQIIYLTGHAGGTHMAALLDAGETLLTEFPDLKVAVVNILEVLMQVLKAEPDLIQTKGDGHAGEVETSIIQAIYPDMVKGSAPEEWPNFPNFLLARHKRPYWPGGVWGNPGAATPEKGERILARETDLLVELVDKMGVFAG
jgi:creatinine amidohydrolase